MRMSRGRGAVPGSSTEVDGWSGGAVGVGSAGLGVLEREGSGWGWGWVPLVVVLFVEAGGRVEAEAEGRFMGAEEVGDCVEAPLTCAILTTCGEGEGIEVAGSVRARCSTMVRRMRLKDGGTKGAVRVQQGAVFGWSRVIFYYGWRW